jgi:GT2 family glycosyltransferase
LAAGAHWILLLDDDVVLEPNVLESLSKAAVVAQPEVGALFTAVVESGSLAIMHRRRFFPNSLKEQPVSANEYSDDLVAIDEGSFVGFFLRAQAAHHVGLPVPEFFLAYDDTEYSLRLRQAGWKLYLVPRLKVYHRGGAGLRLRNTRYGLKHYYTLRNQLATLAEYGRAPMFRLALPICGHFCFAVATGGVNGFRLFLKAFRDAPEIRQHIRGASYNV